MDTNKNYKQRYIKYKNKYLANLNIYNSLLESNLEHRSKFNTVNKMLYLNLQSKLEKNNMEDSLVNDMNKLNLDINGGAMRISRNRNRGSVRYTPYEILTPAEIEAHKIADEARVIRNEAIELATERRATFIGITFNKSAEFFRLKSSYKRIPSNERNLIDKIFIRTLFDRESIIDDINCYQFIILIDVMNFFYKWLQHIYLTVRLPPCGDPWEDYTEYIYHVIDTHPDCLYILCGTTSLNNFGGVRRTASGSSSVQRNLFVKTNIIWIQNTMLDDHAVQGTDPTPCKAEDDLLYWIVAISLFNQFDEYGLDKGRIILTSHDTQKIYDPVINPHKSQPLVDPQGNQIYKNLFSETKRCYPLDVTITVNAHPSQFMHKFISYIKKIITDNIDCTNPQLCNIDDTIHLPF